MPDPLLNPLQPFLDAITPVIQDQGDWVTADLPRFVAQAVVQRYSKDRPLELVSDVLSDGSANLPLPVAPAGTFGVFDPFFSSLLSVEYPIGEVPNDDVEDGDWKLYRTPAEYKIQLRSVSPAAGDNVRLTWTCQHKDDGSTVPGADVYAVADFAASLALEAMAARAAQSGDNTIGADSVNYRTKGQEFLSLARAKRKSYFNHLGIDESDISVEGKAAISLGHMHEVLSSAGVDRLVHGRYTR